MDSLPFVVSKVSRDFATETNVSIVRISQITAQQRQRQTMATELIAGTLQLTFLELQGHCYKF